MPGKKVVVCPLPMGEGAKKLLVPTGTCTLPVLALTYPKIAVRVLSAASKLTQSRNGVMPVGPLILLIIPPVIGSALILPGVVDSAFVSLAIVRRAAGQEKAHTRMPIKIACVY